MSVLRRLELPELDSLEESYRFDSYNQWGSLTSWRLPTGAQIDYIYSAYKSGNGRPFHLSMYRKDLTLTGHPMYSWIYNRFGDGVIRSVEDYIAEGENPEEFPPVGTNPSKVEVIDPFNNLTVYSFHYSISDCDVYGCARDWDDGLLRQVDTYAGPDEDGTRLTRTTRYSYEHDDPDGSGPLQAYLTYSSLASTKVRANSVPINVRLVEKEVVTPAAGGQPDRSRRTVFGDWLHDDPTQGYYFQAWPVHRLVREYDDAQLYRENYTWRSDPYRFDYHELRNAAGEVIARTDREYTSDLRVKCEVRRIGGGIVLPDNCDQDDSYLQLGDGDVANVYTYSASSGDIEEARALDDSDDFVTTYEHVHGIVKKAGYDDPGIAWDAIDRSIDPATGQVASSSDPAGATTTYSWDDLGRLLSVSPRLPELPVSVDYSAGVHETTITQYRDATDFTQTRYLYDELGRLVEEQRRNIDGGIDVRRTEYDIAGRTTRQSEWMPLGGTPVWTEFFYEIANPNPGPGEPPSFTDPLGRLSKVERPYGEVTETKYEGLETTVTTYGIEGETGPFVASTAYTNDVFGRLVAVDSPGEGADASYAYDEQDNLVEVVLTGESTKGGIDTQIRRFGYDALGRQTYATHPESGTTEYLEYDARGNLLEYRDARQNEFSQTYDAAGRMTQKWVTVNGGPSELLMENVYDVGPGPGPTAGKLTEQRSYRLVNGVSQLVSTVRIGYGLVDDTTSCETTHYSGLNGRPSWRSMKIEPWNSELVTDFCYDDMGMAFLVKYPDYDSSGRTRTELAFDHVNGVISGITDIGRSVDYATNLIYSASGAILEFSRGSGVVNTVERDDLSRPEAFLASLSDGTPIWGTGLYDYDGAGNVKAIGPSVDGMTSSYKYDDLNRLAAATVVYGSPLNTVDLSYAYDTFGSMIERNKQFNTDPPEQTLFTVDPLTNRIEDAQYGASNPVLAHAYDPTGNLTNDGAQGYAFDVQNRLYEVWEQSTGSLTAEYAYDANGYRVRAVVDGVETFYFRDSGGQILSEFRRAVGETGDPGWDRDYIYGLGQPLAVVKNELPAVLARPWATDVSADSITLNWLPSPDTDIDTYVIKRESDSPGELPEFLMVDVSATSVIDDLTGVPGSLFTYTLWSWDTAANVGPLSPPLLVRPRDGQAPPVPENLAADELDGAVRLTWNIPSEPDDFWGYSISRRKLPSGPWMTIHVGTLEQALYMDHDVANGSRYRYRVYSVDTAGNYSTASNVCEPFPDYVKPHDNYPPARPQGIGAGPGQSVGEVLITWQSVLDTDLNGYMIYRSEVAGQLGEYLCVEPPYYGDDWCESAPGTTTAYLDTGRTPGITYYYTVYSYDVSGNLSIAGDVVSASPPSPSLSAPTLNAVTWDVDEGNDPIDWGQFPSTNCATFMPADDRILVRVEWTGDAEQTSDVYRVFRYEGDATGAGLFSFAAVADVPITSASNQYVFEDESLNGAAYTYYVVRVSGSDQSTASTAIVAGNTFGSGPAAARVYNLRGIDGREQFETENARSRRFKVRWSRVAEQQLVGYHVYRRCEWAKAEYVPTGRSLDMPDCSHSWQRVTASPVGEVRTFEDNPGGLNGVYHYAVRAVGPNYEEGPLFKVLAADVNYLGHDPDPLVCEEDDAPCHCFADLFTEHIVSKEVDTHYSEEVSRVNAIQRGFGDPADEPATPTLESIETRYLHGSWMTYHTLRWAANSDSDLAGYYLETAGAAGGPWARLTTDPIAWWETSYDVKAVEYSRWNNQIQDYDYFGSARCAHYRLIAVDEDGNESLPSGPPANRALTQGETVTILGPYSPPSSQLCGVDTPAAPVNVSISTAAEPDYSDCNNEITWDEVPDADTYRVYRYAIRNAARLSDLDQFFYQTAELSAAAACSGGTCAYTETGADGIDCHWGDAVDCEVTGQEAYYVTAMKNGGGESPRSEIVLWNCDPQYAANLPVFPSEGWPRHFDQDVLDVDVVTLWGNAGRVEARRPTRLGSRAISASGPIVANSDSFGTAAETISDSDFRGRGPRPPQRRDECEIDLGDNERSGLLASAMLTLGTSDPPYEIVDLHVDHLGSVRALTDETAAIVSAHAFLPFGEELVTVADPYSKKLFTSHERDRVTKKDYMLARFYGSDVGRFHSVDPSRASVDPSLPGSWNRYTYALNGPLGFVDPDGKVTFKALSVSHPGLAQRIESNSAIVAKAIRAVHGKSAEPRFQSSSKFQYWTTNSNFAPRGTPYVPLGDYVAKEVGGASPYVWVGLRGNYVGGGGVAADGASVSDGMLRGLLFVADYSSRHPGLDGMLEGIKRMVELADVLEIDDEDLERLLWRLGRDFGEQLRDEETKKKWKRDVDSIHRSSRSPYEPCFERGCGPGYVGVYQGTLRKN